MQWLDIEEARIDEREGNSRDVVGPPITPDGMQGLQYGLHPIANGLLDGVYMGHSNVMR